MLRPKFHEKKAKFNSEFCQIQLTEVTEKIEIFLTMALI